MNKILVLKNLTAPSRVRFSHMPHPVPVLHFCHCTPGGYRFSLKHDSYVTGSQITGHSSELNTAYGRSVVTHVGQVAPGEPTRRTAFLWFHVFAGLILYVRTTGAEALEKWHTVYCAIVSQAFQFTVSCNQSL